MQDQQQRLVAHGLLFSRTLKHLTLFQVRVFGDRAPVRDEGGHI